MLIALVLAVAAGAYVLHLRRQLAASEAARQRAFAELEQLHASFARFAPSAVVEELSETGLPHPAESKEVTMLFADLQGFTRMAERLTPEVLVDILNGYFEVASEAISAHHGRVSKFMGDGLLALFGALEPNPWQAKDAVDAALALRDAVARYNEQLAAAGRPRLAVSVGIHRGTVVAGVVGAEALMEHTVLGDAVNVAARVEGLTRTLGADILVTESVRQALDARYTVREFPPVAVKGKSEPIRTFGVERAGTVPAASAS